MEDELMRPELQEITLPLHRDLGRIEGHLAGVEGRIAQLEQRVLRNESIAEEGFRLAEQKHDEFAHSIAAKLDGIAESVTAIKVKQASSDSRSGAANSTWRMAASIGFGCASLFLAVLGLLLHR